MKLFKNQILSSTKIDSQGERVPKHVLEGFVTTYKGKKQPLNQDHDLGHAAAGYIENFRVIKDSQEKDEWVLIGDVYCDDSDLKVALGGFSISYLELTNKPCNSPDFLIYLPYPHYNDTAIVKSILDIENVNVGKWVKKGAEPATIALIGATVVFILKPVWEDLYKTQIAPKLYEFFSKKYNEFKKRKIHSDLIQSIKFNENNIQVIMIPIRGKEMDCFTVEYIDSAMKSVHSFLFAQKQVMPISRIHLYFHNKDEGFKIHRVEYQNGEVVHLA